MDKLILFVISFTLCFIVRFVFYLIAKKWKKTRNGIAIEMKYLINKFKLDEARVDKKGLAAIVSILDAIIVSATLIVVISITENLILELLIGLVCVIVFIYLVYEVLGKILVKRGFDKK